MANQEYQIKEIQTEELKKILPKWKEWNQKFNNGLIFQDPEWIIQDSKEQKDNLKLFLLQKQGYLRAIIETHPENIASRKGIEATSFNLCRSLKAWIIFHKIAIQFTKSKSGGRCQVRIV